MLLIAIDTSGRNGSVALCRGDRDSFEVLQLIMLEGGTYSARLMPTIADLLAAHSFNKEQLDALVVVSGPGSFTGLRVGLATVKALCEVLQKPLVALSTLEAMANARGADALKGHGFASSDALKGHGFSRAESGPTLQGALAAQGRFTIAFDAGRGEVYIGEFELVDSSAKLLREYIAKLDAFSQDAARSGSIVLTPDAKVEEALATAKAKSRLIAPVRADEIGRLGLTKLLRGEVADAAALDANYIRRSDAELFSAPKR